MPALVKLFMRILRVLFLFTSILLMLAIAGVSQTDLNDVHISPKPQGGIVAGTANSIKDIGGSLLHVIKADANLVLVPVSVTDGMERLVKGLNRENFEVFDGKTPQQIHSFSSEDVPISVGIILDVSGSMANKIDRISEAVQQFCEIANPQDEFYLIEFSDEPRVMTDFTSSPSEIEKELLFTHPKGRTSLLDAIYLGLGKMKEAKYQKRALLVISDGGDNHSRYEEREVKAAARESDVLIYSIGIFDRYVPTAEEVRGPSLLSEITEPTGGRAFTLQSVSEMPAVAHHIGTELRTQYVLAYRPKDTPKDGKWHKISVKLRLPKKFAYLRARFRTGYYARGG